MPYYRAELHVHTVLSPCAEVEMIPPLIVSTALEKGINLIAVTDHNATANVSAVQKAAKNSGLIVLPGIELQTREEVHVLGLFDHIDQLASLQSIIDKLLPNQKNDPEFFGEQFEVDESGNFLRREDRLLITSVDISIEKAFTHINNLGGLAIPAHVDRKAFGLIANLGLVPPDLPVEVLEISRHLTIEEARQKFPQLMNYPLIQGGDVHRLEEFLGANLFDIASPTIAEIRLALADQQGRKLTTGMNLI